MIFEQFAVTHKQSAKDTETDPILRNSIHGLSACTQLTVLRFIKKDHEFCFRT